MKKFLFILLITFLFTSFIYSQELQIVNGENVVMDKCGFLSESGNENNSTLNWGYGYDSLLIELNIWKQNPYVKIDSIGLSVQGRPLWQLTISSDPNTVTGKRTVYIHARTHPQETEGFYVTREIIKILLSQTPFAQSVRENCIFYVVPMFNPDGVELGYPRRNANNIDLESNWFTFPNQPEVAALKARFTQLMTSPNPIEVELNMHSSSLCKRYFVYHDSAGTSAQFALMQQDFIEGIRSYYPNGIEPWYYYISWTNGNPMRYPESWFWYYYGESVMALTYEDMYQCSGTGNFDITANALIRGVMAYMNIPTNVAAEDEMIKESFVLEQNYPNPFNPSTRISWQSPIGSWQTIKLYDLLGREIETIVDGYYEAGFHSTLFIVNSSLPSGVYFYKLQVEDFALTKKMMLLR